MRAHTAIKRLPDRYAHRRISDVVVLCSDQETREVVRFWLGDAGIPVELAANGPDAAALLAKKEHRGLIVDRFLPPWPGLDSIGALKRRHPALRVIVIGEGGSDTARLARTVGADILLERPLSRAGIMRALGIPEEEALS